MLNTETGFVIVTCPPIERYWSGTDWEYSIKEAKIYQSRTDAQQQAFNFKRYGDNGLSYRVVPVNQDLEQGKTIYRI